MLKGIKDFQFLRTVLSHSETVGRHKIISDIRKKLPDLTLLLADKKRCILVRVCAYK